MEDWKNKMQHLSDLEYVLFAKETFDRKLFPNDFDSRTVREQCTWINENIVKVFPNTPQSLMNLTPAFYHELNHNCSSPEKPTWLDMTKYRRGQKFVNDNYASMIISMVLGLTQIYNFNFILKPLILSKQSITPFLGFKRQCFINIVPDICRLYTGSFWYHGEPWIEGTAAYKEMQYVCKMHYLMRRKLSELTDEQFDSMSQLVEPWCPDRELLLKDFAAACPFQKIGHRPYVTINNSSHKPKGINNADLTITQCGFISMVLLAPQHIGIHNATDEDLEAYCHMWRYYGYCLGIEDKYNFCRGSLEEIKQRTRDLYENWLVYNFKDFLSDWEHMTRCLIEPANYHPFMYAPYKIVTLLSTDTLNLNMPNLYASLSYTEWIAYKIWTFLLSQGLKLSIIRHAFNKIIKTLLEKQRLISAQRG